MTNTDQTQTQDGPRRRLTWDVETTVRVSPCFEWDDKVVDASARLDEEPAKFGGTHYLLPQPVKHMSVIAEIFEVSKMDNLLGLLILQSDGHWVVNLPPPQAAMGIERSYPSVDEARKAIWMSYVVRMAQFNDKT